MKKILITGGAGFIASNFIRYILNKYRHYDVVNLDKLTYAGNPENIKDLENNPRHYFIKGDICDGKLVDGIVKDIDYCINFAAESHVDRSINAPLDFLHTNVFGTQNLLEASKKYKIKRFVQISTDEVYGSIPEGFSEEKDSMEPNSPYSASKAAADILTQSYYHTYGLPAVIVRSSNNFGQYQYPEKIISLFITNILEGKKVPLYADGMNIRDWIYVLDNCNAIDAVFHEGRDGEIYNAGGGNHLTNLELTNIILSELGKGEDSIEFVKDRPGHDKRYAINASKIRELGWKPRYDFRKAVRETIDWYKANQHWWQKLKKNK